MSKILIIYSSVNGQTEKISRALQSHLTGCEIDLCALKQVNTLDIHTYDQVVLGASVRYGNYSPLLFEFIEKHQDFLTASGSGFFSVNLTARKPEKSSPETNRYIEKFLEKTTWRPKHLAVFAGALKYSEYNWWQTLLIQMIMKITGGSTDTQSDLEFTCWDSVAAFARHLRA